MTENMAGRGEGLAGLKLCPSCQATDNNPYTDANGVAMRACMRCMIQWRDPAALEAAAPPSTAPTTQVGMPDFIHKLVSDWYSYNPFPSTPVSETQHRCAEELKKAWEAAALATPSPQAPALSRHTCDWCGQDLRGAGFDGHYNIYCHKPECARHLVIPTCDCDPEYAHRCTKRCPERGECK